MQSSLISSLSSLSAGDAAMSATTIQTGSTLPFSSLLKDAVRSVQALEDTASSTVEGLISGRGVDIHQAMIATQKADLAFEMTLAVRNKAVAAYQQLMQMQF
jgi:flagellar hook-basal body complex protein FliE